MPTIPGPMESARMLMTEKMPLMMPKERPETVEGEESSSEQALTQRRGRVGNAAVGISDSCCWEAPAESRAGPELTVSHLPQGHGGSPVLADGHQPFIGFPAGIREEQ